MNRPKEPMPERISAWLEVNDDCPWQMCVCRKCGRWYESMDHLAPYHVERCRCSQCGLRGDEEEEE